MTMTMSENDLRATEVHVRIKHGHGPHFDRKGLVRTHDGEVFAINGLELRSFADKFEIEAGDRALAEKILLVESETDVQTAIAAAPAAEAQQEEADQEAATRSSAGGGRRRK